MRVGVIGCGKISNKYLEVMTGPLSHVLEVRACADMKRENAEKRAEEYGIPLVVDAPELLSRDDIDAVLNLTNPWAHLEVGTAVLEAGKHLYQEKPLALSLLGADKLISLAESKNLRIGCAPDTVLGAGIQTCRRVIDDGWIGRPLFVEASIVMAVNREQYTSAGVGGVLLDMGPYYISALIQLFGAIDSVGGAARVPLPNKRAWDTAGGAYGRAFKPESPTAAAAVLEFKSGMAGTFTATSDGHSYIPHLRVVGSDGVLEVPDPNMFARDIRIHRRGSEPTVLPYLYGFADNTRGLGLADMARAIAEKRPHRANAEIAYHVLETLLSIAESSEKGARIDLSSSCERPAPMPDHTVDDPLFS